MYPANFDYVRAESVDQALALLGEHDDAKLLAGGHSLVPMLKMRLAEPGTLVDIGRIAELRGITVSGGEVTIGALTTHHDMATSADLAEHCPIIAEAAKQIADPQVRNKGTLGGNIAHADPASDLPAVMLAIGATVHLRSASGERKVAAADFFTGLLETAMAEGEILIAVSAPVLGKGDGSSYQKFEHPASGYAVVGAAAVIRDGQAHLAFNGLADHAFLASGHGVSLGSDLSDSAITSALDGLSVEYPMSDVQASGEYRLHLARVYGRRALQAARDA